MLGGLPVEMITMLGSSVLGGVMSIWSQSIKAKQDEQKMLLARADNQMKHISDARNYDNKGFQFTRGFLFLVEQKEITMDKEFFGVVITPLDTHLMSAIIGLYFGGSLVKK